MIESLPPLDILGHSPSTTGNDRHPMRLMTRRVAGLDPGEWDDDARSEVTDLFDELADDWHTRITPESALVVADALERGLDRIAHGSGLAVEVGSGIGTYSRLIGKHFDRVVSVDLSFEMLTRAGSTPLRVMADGGRLPLGDRSVDAVVLINAFAFPREIDRILAASGCVVWVNSSGEDTPIHLTTADLVRSLPFAVNGVESRAGAGTWCVLRRS